MEIGISTIFYCSFLFYETMANPCHTPPDKDAPIKVNYSDPIKNAIHCFILLSEEKTNSLLTFFKDKGGLETFRINKTKAQDICREFKATLPIFEHDNIAQFFLNVTIDAMRTNKLNPDNNQVWVPLALSVKPPDAAGMVEATWDNGFQNRIAIQHPYGLRGSWEFIVGPDMSITTLSDRGDFTTFNDYEYKGFINARVYFFCHHDPSAHSTTTILTVASETKPISAETEIDSTLFETPTDTSESQEQTTTPLFSISTSLPNASTLIVGGLKLFLIYTTLILCEELLMSL